MPPTIDNFQSETALGRNSSFNPLTTGHYRKKIVRKNSDQKISIPGIFFFENRQLRNKNQKLFNFIFIFIAVQLEVIKFYWPLNLSRVVW